MLNNKMLSYTSLDIIIRAFKNKITDQIEVMLKKNHWFGGVVNKVIGFENCAFA